jgi:hypothetical protein
MTRRRFAFWIGFGLFGISNKLGLRALDSLAAAAMEGASKPGQRRPPEHWTTAGDDTWTWFERENYIEGEWRLTGTTRPVHKETAEPKPESSVYLDDELVPPAMRASSDGAFDSSEQSEVESASAIAEDETTEPHQLPTPTSRARHGRPPSKWLRSLNADELRIWLATVEVPEAGVSGMTYWEHLTRDHSFDPLRIEGLAEEEQAKLHAAAHFGY